MSNWWIKNNFYRCLKAPFRRGQPPQLPPRNPNQPQNPPQNPHQHVYANPEGGAGAEGPPRQQQQQQQQQHHQQQQQQPRLPPRHGGPQEAAANGAARRIAEGAGRFVAGQLFRVGAEQVLAQFANT